MLNYCHCFQGEKNYDFKSASFELVDLWVKSRVPTIFIWFAEHRKSTPPTPTPPSPPFDLSWRWLLLILSVDQYLFGILDLWQLSRCRFSKVYIFNFLEQKFHLLLLNNCEAQQYLHRCSAPPWFWLFRSLGCSSAMRRIYLVWVSRLGLLAFLSCTSCLWLWLYWSAAALLQASGGEWECVGEYLPLCWPGPQSPSEPLANALPVVGIQVTCVGQEIPHCSHILGLIQNSNTVIHFC